MKRARQLQLALKELEGGHHNTLSDALRRVLRLLELCPWLQEGEAPPAPKARGKRKTPAGREDS